jgi:hypothetical protein
VLPRGLPTDDGWRRLEIEGLPDVALYRVRDAFARAWIVETAIVAEPPKHRDSRSLDAYTAALLFPGGRLRDLRREAVVETRRPLPELPPRPAGAAQPHCSYTWVRPREVHVDVRLRQRSLLVVSDSFDPGWRATDFRDDGPPAELDIFRVNRIMKGMVLEPGRHRVVLVYEPSFWPLAARISLAAWAILMLSGSFAAWRWCRDRELFATGY